MQALRMSKIERINKLRGEPCAETKHCKWSSHCHETSDAAKLCKTPVVSVLMITYNHGPYILQAIEGVVRQETDFDYELVIGEDCSKDNTREICFECQKKFPSIIRVLWSDGNVNVSENWARTRERCRGEYIAFCEGDDYWTDTRKLQKQVEVLKGNPGVAFCFSRAELFFENTGERKIWDCNTRIPSGVIPGRQFLKWHSFGREANAPSEEIEFLMTATVLARRSLVDRLEKDEAIFRWQLLLLDTTYWSGLASLGDVYYLPDVVSVYRINQGGICMRNPFGVCRDTQIIRLYWMDRTGLGDEAQCSFVYGRLFSMRLRNVLLARPKDRIKEARSILALDEFKEVHGLFRCFVVLCSKRWMPMRLLLAGVTALSTLRRKLLSDGSR